MPAMTAHIVKTGDTFILSIYEIPQDIGVTKPIDMWELDSLVVDDATLCYLATE